MFIILYIIHDQTLWCVIRLDENTPDRYHVYPKCFFTLYSIESYWQRTKSSPRSHWTLCGMRQDPRWLGRLRDGHLFVAWMCLTDDMQSVFTHHKIAVLAATLQNALQLKPSRLLELRRCAATTNRRNCWRMGSDRRDDSLCTSTAGDVLTTRQHAIGEQMVGTLPDGCDGAGLKRDDCCCVCCNILQKRCTDTVELSGPHCECCKIDDKIYFSSTVCVLDRIYRI